MKISKDALPTGYKLVADVPEGTVFKYGISIYMKCRGNSECECNVVDLKTGDLKDLDSGTAIDCAYPDATIALGREDR